jgi:3-oxoacyl-[acyl-carrier-protein] synthase-3
MRLAGLACHVPQKRVDAGTIITAAGGRSADAKVFTKLFGTECVAVAEPAQTPAVRFAPVIHGLERSVGKMPIDTLIYVHGLPTQYGPGRSPLTELVRLHPSLFVSVRLSYEVDQNNCAGLFWALQMARQLLDTRLADCVAIVAGDCLADFHLSHRYVPGCTLIGDAFVALLLDSDTGGVQIGKLVLRHRPEFPSGLYGRVSEVRRFNQAHDQMVLEALDAVGFPRDGEEKLLPHNVNRLIWLQFCRGQGIKPDRLRLDLIPDIGHCYTTDPVLLLDRLLTGDQLPSSAVTLLSTGLGAYTGACRIYLP